MKSRMPSLGETIAAWRRHREFSVYRLAKEAGVHPAQILRIEAGKTQSPRRDTLEKIARVLGVTPTTFAIREQPSPSLGTEIFDAQFRRVLECPICRPLITDVLALLHRHGLLDEPGPPAEYNLEILNIVATLEGLAHYRHEGPA